MTTLRGALALALLTLAPAAAFAATPAPKPMVLPTPRISKVPLTTSFVVEVNKLGQVVRVKSGKDCNNPTFNAQTYGNVLQMWIRHADGTAETGLYKVVYHLVPEPSGKNAQIKRDFWLISAGGDWADKRGAANEMMDDAQQENEKAAKARSGESLPSLNQILAVPSTSPSPRH